MEEQQFQGYFTRDLVEQVQTEHLTTAQLIEAREENQASAHPDQDWDTSLSEAIVALQPQ
jgi:hypothetical protein